MLSLILLSVVGLISAAPAPEPVPLQPLVSPADVSITQGKQIFVLTPQAPQAPLIQPTVHQYREPIHLAPLRQVKQVYAPASNVVFYPNIPLYPNEHASLRQLDPSQIQSTISQFNDTFNNINMQLSQAASDFFDQYYPNLTPSSEKIEFNPDAETFTPPQPGTALPAAPPAAYPAPLPQPAAPRVYTVAGVPQFFGNFDFFRTNPNNPIFSLQPLQPIRARSIVHPVADAQLHQQPPILQPILVPNAAPLNSAKSIDYAQQQQASELNARLTPQILLAEQQPKDEPQSSEVKEN